MKIIEKGAKPEKGTKKTCYKCKTKFTYLPSDLKYDREGSYVICPYEDCGAFIAV